MNHGGNQPTGAGGPEWEVLEGQGPLAFSAALYMMMAREALPPYDSPLWSSGPHELTISWLFSKVSCWGPEAHSGGSWGGQRPPSECFFFLPADPGNT